LRGQIDTAVFIRNLQTSFLPPGANFPGATEVPDAEPDISPLSSGQPVTIPVLANDLDFESQALMIVSVTQPSQGTVSIDPGGKTVTSFPGAFSLTPVSFTYTVADPRGLTATSTVTLFPLVQSSATGVAAPANQVPGVATGIVSGSFFNATAGSDTG